MWKNFMTAIGLLAIALITALYSSSAGRDGRVVPAAISAFLALGIAVLVGIRFVPQLASNVDWEWLPFISRYHVTREGWIYFGAITVVVFAAVNTANNLLYMVLSALLAVLPLSAFLSGLNFRFLKILVRVPSHCFAGEPFPLSIQISNEKRLFPSFSILFAPVDGSPFQFSNFYVPVVRSLGSTPQLGQAMINRRGRFEMKQIQSSSRYPFGFLLKKRTYPAKAECICYPEIIPSDQLDFSIIDLTGENQRLERGLGQDLYMIRDYVPSDSARHVHWKASAKTSTLKTREYSAEESRRVRLSFDRYGQPADSEKFEQLVSYAASLAYHLANDGIEVSFSSDEWHSPSGDLDSILEYLALVQMSAQPGALRREGLWLSIRS
jgi:uncharacterized protein (DUF58 family)